MKKLFGTLALLCAVATLGFLLFMRSDFSGSSLNTDVNMPVPVEESAAPVAATPEVTPELVAPTPEPTPEPEPEVYTLSFIGDLTLTGAPGTPVHFEATMNGDYGYPFSNVVQYFSDDEYTIGNLECTFSDQYLSSIETFSFRAPTTSANILLEGGVDFVTTANNHSDDFHTAGKRDTWATLEEYGIAYGKNDEYQIVTTPNGLRLGIYCQFSNAYGDFRPDEEKGIELNYYPEQRTPETVNICRRCIDEGADIIYGSHPHCLQPMEEYNGGIILYSMGNFIFGGVSSLPVTDPNLSAAVRRPKTDYNDFRPTPYEEGSDDYNRALSKIDGSYAGPDGQADYSDWHSQHQ